MRQKLTFFVQDYLVVNPSHYNVIMVQYDEMLIVCVRFFSFEGGALLSTELWMGSQKLL